MVNIVVKNIRSKISGQLPNDILQELDDKLSYFTEGYFFASQYSKGRWDGKKRLFDKRYQTFDTGCFFIVKRILDAHGISFKVDEKRNKPTPGLAYTPKEPARPYQVEAIEAALKTKRGVLLMATGSGKCVSCDSLVKTHRGLRNIGSFNTKLLPDTAVEKKINIITTKGIRSTSHFYNGGYAKTKVLETNFAYTIEGTYEHPILCLSEDGRKQYKRLDEIVSTDYIAVDRSHIEREYQTLLNNLYPDVSKLHGNCKICTFPTTLSEDLCELLGWLVGEAHFPDPKYNWFSFYQKDVNTLYKVAELFRSVFGLKVSPNVKKEQILIANKSVNLFLQNLGVDFVLSEHKRVPFIVLQASHNKQKSFIRALFDAEANVTDKEIEFSSASEEMVKQLQILLLNFGIVSSRKSYMKSATNGKKNKKPYWSLRISCFSVNKFQDLIGFSIGYKRRRLNQLASVNRNPNKDVVPYINRYLRNLTKRYNVKAKDYLKYDNTRWLKNEDNVSYRRLQRFLSVIEPYIDVNDADYLWLKEINQQHLFWDKVSVVKNSEAEVRDLTVPEEHHYIANGIVCHNTFVISSIVGRVNLPTIIYVHTKDLLYQMKANIERFLGVTCGQIGGGIVDIRRWNVAMMQTVCKALKSKYEKYDDEEEDDETDIVSHQDLIKAAVHEASVMIVDECHHVSCTSYSTISRASKNAYYRLGFTATLREDGADLLIHGATGRTLYAINASDLIKMGFLVKPTIYFINVPKPTNTMMYMGNYQKIYKNNIVENDIRNDLVVKAAAKLVDRKMNVLILVKQIVHGKTLYHRMKKIGKTVFVQGQMSGQARQEILEAFKQHQIDILIATSLADEGLDLPNLNSVILAGSGKSSVKAFQRIGRVLRPYPGKEKAIVIDFNDSVKYLNRHSKRRLFLYKQESEFEIKIQNGK